jgi:hypothetical protein
MARLLMLTVPLPGNKVGHADVSLRTPDAEGTYQLVHELRSHHQPEYGLREVTGIERHGSDLHLRRLDHGMYTLLHRFNYIVHVGLGINALS